MIAAYGAVIVVNPGTDGQTAVEIDGAGSGLAIREQPSPPATSAAGATPAVAPTSGDPNQFTWQEFLSAAGGFRVLLLALREERTVTAMADAPGGERLVYRTSSWQQFDTDPSEVDATVEYSEYPPGVVEHATPQQLLDQAQARLLRGPGAKLLSAQPLTLQGYPGRELIIDLRPPWALHERVYVVKNRLYEVQLLTVGAQAVPGEVTKFLDSFRLLAP